MHRIARTDRVPMRHRLILAVTLLLAGAVGAWPTAVAEAHPTSAYCYRPFERQLLTLINNYRASVNPSLPRLKLSQTLGAAAQHYSRDMATNNFTPDAEHHDSQGKTPSQRMIDHGFPMTAATFRGENVYAGFGDGDGDGIPGQAPQEAFDWWKQSPPHNANMLNGNYRAIGISRAFNAASDLDYYWTTDFTSAFDAAARIC